MYTLSEQLLHSLRKQTYLKSKYPEDLYMLQYESGEIY